MTRADAGHFEPHAQRSAQRKYKAAVDVRIRV